MSSFTLLPENRSAVHPVNIVETPPPRQHLEAKPHCWGRGAGMAWRLTHRCAHCLRQVGQPVGPEVGGRPHPVPGLQPSPASPNTLSLDTQHKRI